MISLLVKRETEPAEMATIMATAMIRIRKVPPVSWGFSGRCFKAGVAGGPGGGIIGGAERLAGGACGPSSGAS